MANQFVNYSEDFPLQLMEHMGDGFSLFSFCGKINIERETLLRWLDSYPEFKSAHKIGLEKALYYWELQMKNCANGKDRANASMICFKLRNTYKDMYADSQKLEASGNIVITVNTGIRRDSDVIDVVNEAVDDKLKELL